MTADKSIWRFFALVFALSAPLWLFGPWLEQRLAYALPVQLPLSALMAFMPLTAALVLESLRGGGGVKALLIRIVHIRGAKAIWLVIAALLMPAVLAAAYGVMRAVGASLPEPALNLAVAPIMFGAFFLAAIGEEAGWQGYAYDPLEARYGALGATALLALIGVVWHIIPFLQTGRAIDWIVLHCFVIVGLRIFMVWLYLRAGRSVLAATLFHAMSNVAFFLFPNYGSHYDPLYALVVMVPLAIMVIAFGGLRSEARTAPA